MMRCPRCRVHVEREESSHGIQWRCPQCEGRALTVGAFRRIVRRESVNRLWQAAKTAGRPTDLACALCGNSMKAVQEFDAIELDVCTVCQGIWFDPTELDRAKVDAGLPREPEEPGLAPKAREILALARVEQMRRGSEAQDGASPLPPDEGWKAILTVFGVPVEEDVPVVSRWPLVTWAALLLMALGTAWPMFWDATAIERWGVLPADPWRHGGLPFLSSFFLHAGIFHFMGNAMFLWIFGDNVEDYLGHLKYAALLLLSSFAGDLLHLAFEPRHALPVVGASAGISGVIVFYALAFPRARLVMMWRVYFYIRWVRFPAWIGLIAWAALQGWGVFEQMGGLSNVSSLAHLGGAGVGLLAWLILRRREAAPAESAYE